MRVPGISQEETDTMAHGTHKTRDIIYINNKIMIYKDGRDRQMWLHVYYICIRFERNEEEISV